tara:strand:- start:1369 stop:1881 length:513 start_codon:yes stop_codon:yes gene_type:complete
MGRSNGVSQIYILTNEIWGRRTTVSGTSGEGKSVRAANDGKAFASASDSQLSFFPDFTVKQNPFGWKQRGNTISIPSYVRSIALSDNGNYIVVGLYKEPGLYLDANAGSVRVYSLNGSTWTQREFDVVHDTGNTFFGYAVAISPDGTKFAAGGNGLVRVFTNEALGTRSA